MRPQSRLHIFQWAQGYSLGSMVFIGGIFVCKANHYFCFLRRSQGIAVVVECDLSIARARDAVVPTIRWKVTENAVGD